MAQHAGGTLYDFAWDKKLLVALNNLRAVADRCASGCPEPVEPQRVMAVVLAVLCSEWSRFDLEDDLREQLRPLDSWIAVVEAPEAYCRLLLPKADSLTIELVISSLLTALRLAMRAWADGNPEDPTTEATLNYFVQQLHAHHAKVRPPSPRHRFPLFDLEQSYGPQDGRRK